MARATYVPINGDVLAWAMEQAGVDDLELAERCGTSPDVVEEWRDGDLEPTKTQFRQLVARLRRPASILLPGRGGAAGRQANITRGA